MTKRLAVIPARGGSTRLKDKNLHPLGGKPLIGWTIEAVLGSGAFDTVVVSTDSERIAEVARSYAGVDVHERPAQYATERVTVLDALVAMMAEVERHDVFAYFLPTCPFRNAADIAAGAALLTPEVDSVISVTAYEAPPQFAMIKRGDTLIPVFDNLTLGATNSKFIQRYHRPNGGFYMTWWDRLLEHRNFYVGEVRGHEMPRERALDIDVKVDVLVAEAALAAGLVGAPDGA